MKELIALTEAQSVVIKKMYELYVKAQDMGICFAVNENSNLVAYNGLEIEDCADRPPLSSPPEGYEYADMEQMREVFPVWDCYELYLKRK